MRRIKVVGLCLLAVLAVSAVATASASAGLPEFGGCEATAGGKYEDSACTVRAHSRKADGKYEWYTGAQFGTVWRKERGSEIPYKLEHNHEWEFGPVTFETAAGRTIQCTVGEREHEGGYGSLHLLNEHPKEVGEVRFEIEECTSEGAPCYSLPYEDLNNRDQWYYEGGFIGKLGFISGRGTESPVVGLSLTTPKNSESGEDVPLLVANCEGKVGTITIGGSHPKEQGNGLIALVTTVDTPTHSLGLAWSESHGVQEPSGFEHEHIGLQALVESEWEPVAMQAEVSIPISGPALEVKAKP
jgi:hypothetical protein